MILACFGDSITEGYMVPEDCSWPSVLERLSKGRIKTLNLGISGETTLDAIKRINEVVSSRPQMVFLEFGINDFFWGFPVESVKENLNTICKTFLDNDIKVILCGFDIKGQPLEKWKLMYKSLAGSYKLPLYEDIFSGLKREEDHFLPDGLHPNEEGYRVMSSRIFEFLKKNFPKLILP